MYASVNIWAIIAVLGSVVERSAGFVGRCTVVELAGAAAIWKVWTVVAEHIAGLAGVVLQSGLRSVLRGVVALGESGDRLVGGAEGASA